MHPLALMSTIARRGWLLCALALSVCLAGIARAEEKVLNVYNWSDYIAEDTIPNFEKRTGIKVNYDVFDSNEVLEAKLLAGGSGYDIVVPSASFLERQIKAGVFQPLSKDKLKNLANMDRDIMARVATHDPNNGHAVPYLWGTTGIGYNTKKVKAVMADAPVGSWDMVFKPEVVSKLSECGVTMLDAPTEVFENALNYLGLDPHSESKEDLEKATEMLLKIRPHIKYFHSSQNINDLANGEICVSMGWSGDMLIARDRAAEADQGIEITYTIPKEGTIMWFDMLAIPSDAPNRENAHLFIDYLMEPEVAAGVSNYVFYANANEKATPLVEKTVTEDPAIYPPDAVKAKLFADTAKSAKYTRLLTRAWTKVKTGR